jgi:hypothetical protein
MNEPPLACWRKVGEALSEKPDKAAKCLKWLALPRDGAEASDFNGLKKSLGSNCLIAFQSVSERLPKPALQTTKAEPRRRCCKLTGDGAQNRPLGAI